MLQEKMAEEVDGGLANMIPGPVAYQPQPEPMPNLSPSLPPYSTLYGNGGGGMTPYGGYSQQDMSYAMAPPPNGGEPTNNYYSFSHQHNYSSSVRAW